MTPFARYCALLERLTTRMLPYDEARQLKAQGVSIREIGKRLGVSRETVRKWCASDAPVSPRKKHAPETESRYWELRKVGVSIRKAARELGLSKGTVQWWEDKARKTA
jgi:transposase